MKCSDTGRPGHISAMALAGTSSRALSAAPAEGVDATSTPGARMRGVYEANPSRRSSVATRAAATQVNAGHQPIREWRVDQDAPQQCLTLRFQRLGSEQPVPLCRTRRTHPRVPAQVVARGDVHPPRPHNHHPRPYDCVILMNGNGWCACQCRVAAPHAVHHDMRSGSTTWFEIRALRC